MKNVQRVTAKMNERIKLFIKRITAGVSFAVIVIILTFLTYFFVFEFRNLKDVASFKKYLSSFGIFGIVVGFLLQVLQVFIAFIPGEVVEVGLGFTYGSIVGTLICYSGLFVATSIVFQIVKKFGTRFVELFVSSEKINSLKFVRRNINNPIRLQKIAFILYFIPGTPKDLFTYFFGLTPMKYSEFIVISLIARIPSVISSTIGGNLVASGNFVAAVILFVITGIVSICGWLWYSSYIKNKGI